MTRHTFLLGTTALCAAGLLAVPAAPTATAARPPAQPMRIRTLSATPHTVARHGTLTFTATVSGLILDLAHLGQRPRAGHGHLQYYLDRIPADAWTRPDRHHGYIAAVATPRFFLAIVASPVRITPGTHRFLVALARNDGVLYHAPVASVRVTVTR